MTIHEDCFGKLRFVELKDSAKNYYEGKGYFAPTNNEIEYLIFADKEAPTEKQKEFYKNLQIDFNKYVEKIVPLIENEFHNWKNDFIISDFNNEFKLV